MKTFIRDLIKKTAPHIYWNNLIAKRVVRNKESFLHQSGWYNSLVKGKPISDSGEEMPWLNYGFFNFIRERLSKDFVIFEYGSGASTFYFAKNVKKVISVEHDKDWYNKVLATKADNVELLFKDLDMNGKYCSAINEYETNFDIVLVDGRDRVNCVKKAISKLSPSGVIILDNSHREKYASIFLWDGLKEFKHITFTGILPGGFKPDATTVFYRTDNCLYI